MGYGIFRVEKLKTMGNLQGSMKHALREQLTLNADPKRLKDNVLLTPDTPTVQAVMDKYESMKPEKIRNDQVRAIEVLITASPEAIEGMTAEQRKDYFDRSLKFANNEFGESNLLHAQIHYDEKTAHLTAFYIPLVEKEGKKGSKITLNAKELLGGRKEYSDRQTRFYELVSKDFGLLRGEVDSKATHKPMKDFYREGNKAADLLKKIAELNEKTHRLESNNQELNNKMPFIELLRKGQYDMQDLILQALNKISLIDFEEKNEFDFNRVEEFLQNEFDQYNPDSVSPLDTAKKLVEFAELTLTEWNKNKYRKSLELKQNLDPKFIKEMYDEECKKLFEKHKSVIETQLNSSLDARTNNYRIRLENFNRATERMNEILKYTNGRFPSDLIELHQRSKNKLEEDKHLAKLSGMSMRM